MKHLKKVKERRSEMAEAKPIRIHEGSAKQTLVYKEPSMDFFGDGAFQFLNFFSIFDWGRFLNDPITAKAIAMAVVARKHFELLKSTGIKTHFRGMTGPTKMNIALVNIPEPYKDVVPGLKNYLLPIEIIHRTRVHPESSDLKKIKAGKRTYQELGYAKMPCPHEKLEPVKISWSTKLEEEDRVLSKEEARILAGLNPEEMDCLEALATEVNAIIVNHCESLGFLHYDGKIEVAKDSEGEFMVIDVLGTLEEDRFMVKVAAGIYVDVSKQFLRNWHIDTGWKKIVDAAKSRAEKEDIRNWKAYCSEPPKLPARISALATEMYLADAELRTGEKLGEVSGIKVRPLQQVAKELYEIQEAHGTGVTF